MSFVSLDLLDREACARAIKPLTDLTHVCYTAVLEKPGAVFEGWVDPEVWEQAREHMYAASRLLHDANRPPRSEGTVHVSFTAFAFAMQPPTQRDTQPPATPDEEPEHTEEPR